MILCSSISVHLTFRSLDLLAYSKNSFHVFNIIIFIIIYLLYFNLSFLSFSLSHVIENVSAYTEPPWHKMNCFPPWYSLHNTSQYPPGLSVPLLQRTWYRWNYLVHLPLEQFFFCSICLWSFLGIKNIFRHNQKV